MSEKPAVNHAEWKRLSEKAGIPQLSYTAYPYLDYISEEFLKKIISKTLIFMEHDNRITVYRKDVENAISVAGYSPLFDVPDEGLKRCKISNARRPASRTRSYQSQYNCLMTAKAPFRAAVIRLIGNNRIRLCIGSDRILLSEKSLTSLHIAFETFIHSILTSSAEVMYNAKRKTLHRSDIKVASKIVLKNCSVMNLQDRKLKLWQDVF